MVVHFLFGFAGSFLGGVALGPINLSVMELTLRKSISCATRFIIAASIVELFLAWIAILFGKLIAKSLDEIPEFKLLVIAFFFIIGLVFLFKKDKPKSELPDNINQSSFLNGFLIATANPD
jgi:threonine/homoserine/homoserine lactone efflux protein